MEVGMTGTKILQNCSNDSESTDAFGHRLRWMTSLVAKRLKCLPAMLETRVWSLGQKDPLEKAMAPHPSILAWRIPWTEEPGGLQSIGLQRVRRDLSAKQYHTVVCFDKARKSPGTSRSPELDPGRGWFGVCGCACQGSNALHARNP